MLDQLSVQTNVAQVHAYMIVHVYNICVFNLAMFYDIQGLVGIEGNA